MKWKWLRALTLFLLIAPAGVLPSEAASYRVDGDVVGTIHVDVVKEDDSLIEMARRFDVGYNGISAANEGVDPFVPETGVTVLVPTQWILPDVPARRGIIINLAEMRLYYFHPRAGGMVETFPVGIGDEGWDTPIGRYRIIEKIANPTWYVPASIREQKPELPASVPPGPDNPLGTHALRLSIGTVLIHGTNRPFGIGRKVSHGCIHLYPEDIVQLFKRVKVGTSVVIVDQPVKIGMRNGRVFAEVHRSGSGGGLEEALRILRKKKLIAQVSMERLRMVVKQKRGLPEDISR
ncbi:MAG TPA: L,D-transpeptidase family protein [Geobacteraceae bacterium]